MRLKQKNKTIVTSFGDYKEDAHNWITLATGEFYPDILPQACELYKPVLVLFGQFLRSSESSAALFRQICEVAEGWMRIQLARVFQKYVRPNAPVERLKRKKSCEKIIEHFGKEFRPIQEVRQAYETRPIPDEALCAVLWEYDDVFGALRDKPAKREFAKYPQKVVYHIPRNHSARNKNAQ